MAARNRRRAPRALPGRSPNYDARALGQAAWVARVATAACRRPAQPAPSPLLSLDSRSTPPKMLSPLQAYKQLCQLQRTLPQTASTDCKLLRTNDDTSEGKPNTVQELADSRNSPSTSENISCGSREASPLTLPAAERRTPAAVGLCLPPVAEARVPAATDSDESKCWGSLFDHHQCQGTTGGNGEKLIDKFCSACRTTGLLVTAERVRALLPEHYERFANSRRGGFWTECGDGSTPRFRVVNQTKECRVRQAEDGAQP